MIVPSDDFVTTVSRVVCTTRNGTHHTGSNPPSDVIFRHVLFYMRMPQSSCLRGFPVWYELLAHHCCEFPAILWNDTMTYLHIVIATNT